jgi:hypothetical protein
MASTSGMKRAAADAGGEELQRPDYVWKADETKLEILSLDEVWRMGVARL